jgi:AraC family ethanolamine operon transcriptional activator
VQRNYYPETANFMNFSPSTAKNLFPSSLRLDLISHDAEQMREQSVYWPFEHSQYGRGKFSGRIRGVHTRRLQLSLAERTQGVCIRGSIPAETIVISFPLTPARQLYYRGKKLDSCQSIALRHNEELELQTCASSALITVAVSADFFEQQARVITGMTFDSLRRQGRIGMTATEHNRKTTRLLSMLRTILLTPDLPEQRQEESFEKSVTDIILTGLQAPDNSPAMPQRLQLAKKAELYILQHLKNPPAIDRLSRIIGTSERALHQGFKERFGVSPKMYIQIMRLNEAHKELRDSSSRKTVSDTAMEWGFYHLGRFSNQYKRMFGQLPSTTQKRDSPGAVTSNL